MGVSVKKAYKIYMNFMTFGGGLNCKLFTEVFPKLTADDSFEYEEMKEGYNPEEFAKSYLRPEVLELEMNNPYKREAYERLSSLLS